MLLVVAEAQLAEAVAGAGIFGEHGFEVGDGFFGLAGVALGLMRDSRGRVDRRAGRVRALAMLALASSYFSQAISTMHILVKASA